MADRAKQLREAVIESSVHGPGRTTTGERAAAFANAGVDERARALIEKVARNAYRVTAEDIAATIAAGLTEDQVFELVVSAALGQATRQLDAVLAIVEQA